MSQNGPKTTSLMMSLIKNPQPSTKKLFKCGLEDWPIRLSLEQFSSTIGRGARLLVRQPKTAGFRLKSTYEYIVRWLSNC